MVIKHLDLFSGIGGFRKAIDILSYDFNIESKSVGFSEIDIYATKTYKANFNVDLEKEIGDIVAFTRAESNVIGLEDFDLVTGGFPCQSFSMMGKQKGFNDMRGNLFFNILDIVKVKKPKFILLENVKNIVTHNNGETIKTIVESLNDVGYPFVYYDIFDTSKFSLAQIRNRVYIFASRVKLNDNFTFNSEQIADSFNRIKNNSNLIMNYSTWDILDKRVDRKYYLSEVIKPTILSDGSKNYKSKSTIDQILAKPLTATMAKMHRACQDNYFSDDYIKNYKNSETLIQKLSKKELANKQIRRLTPKEAFLLQGFSEEFYHNAIKAGISDSQLYKQAGNAVSVNTVYAILYYLFIENQIMGG